MRASLYLVLALLSCSCATFPQLKTCPEKPGPPRTREVVISDIDDTIKDTHVRLAGTHAYNPLLVLEPIRPWHRVEEIASLYSKQKWTDARTTVIYVSAARCTTSRRAALERFIEMSKFPTGQLLLRAGGGLIAPHDYKTKAIYPIIMRLKKYHHFVFVGDSGEFDPECYGDLAREFPQQVDEIYIRIVSSENDDRFRWAFRDIDPHKIHFIPDDSLHWSRADASALNKAGAGRGR
jgi:phosphatidate phosphatase APP1